MKTNDFADIPGLKKGVRLTGDQANFVKFIERQGSGVNAADTGTGKTLASIAAALRLRETGRSRNALVVVPAALKRNFADNVRKYTNASVGVINSSRDIDRFRNRDFSVISYDLARKNAPRLTGYDTVIADEIHRAKDKTTVNHAVLRRLRGRSKHMIGLTATPAQNNVYEALNIHNVISPRPMKIGEFSRKFENRRLRGVMEHIRAIVTGKPGSGELKGYYNQRTMARMFGDVFMMPTAKAPDMPSVKEQFVIVPMNQVQRTAYRRALRKDLSKREISLLKDKKLDINLAERIVNRAMAARQVSNDPGYLTASKRSMPFASSKAVRAVKDALDHIATDPRNRVLMYSSFKNHGTRTLGTALSKLNIPFAKFTGGMPQNLKEQAVDNFRKGNKRILLITGAGAEGLNLPDTTMISLLDGHYNPMKIKQIIGRGVRRGGLRAFPAGQRRVVVNKYIADPKTGDGAIDQHVYRVAESKEKAVKDFWNAIQTPRWTMSPRQRAALMGGAVTMGALTLPSIIRRRGRILSGIRGLGRGASWAAARAVGGLGFIRGVGRLAKQMASIRKLGSGHDYRARGIHEITSTENEKWPFVIQRHRARHKHYDIRMWDKKARAGHSWATIRLPDEQHKTTLVARQASHPLSYFRFRGTIPGGYGKGTVSTVFQGVANIKYSTPDRIRFSITGKKAKSLGDIGNEFILLKQPDDKWRLVRLEGENK